MEVSPFRGIRYDQRIVGDLARVICPPYDVISLEQQKLYYEQSDYNAIRLELPSESLESAGDKYERATDIFHLWLKHGVLEVDTVSSFYLHDHRFEYSGEKRTRRGLVARVRLEPWGNGVYPHEETSPKDKSDRLHLMRACRANFSPLFSLYRDSGQNIAPILARAARQKPLMVLPMKRGNLVDSDEVHTLWAITEPAITAELGELLSFGPLYIADGHHRYETALTYQQERTQGQSKSLGSSVIVSELKQSLSSTEGFNYVMMELVEFSDPGLVVLPLHRLVRGITPSVLQGLKDRLREFFAVESVRASVGSCQLPIEGCLGVLGLESGSLVVLKKRHGVSVESLMPANRSQAYREFGVSILNHVILDGVLGETKDLDVLYSVDLKEAYRLVEDGKYQLGFLLNPPQPEMVRAVADAQDRMPRKSTYFYPKLPAGLVINPLD